MLKAITENDELVNVKATKDGKLLVNMGEESTGGSNNGEVKVINQQDNPIPIQVMNQLTIPDNFKVNNTETSPIPVELQNQEIETTLNASIQTVGTTASTIAINKKVTSIDIANYSETANLTVTIGSLSAVIGENLAVNIPVNKDVTNISITSTEADTKVQLIVKGVE